MAQKQRRDRESAVWGAVGEGLVRLDAGALIAAWSPGAAELYGRPEADAEILDAALALLRAGGYRELSLDEVARRAGT